MAMPGTGCFIAVHYIKPGHEADYENWHTHEHMIERLTIPGFLRGLRYRSLAPDTPRVCTIYQVDSLSTLTSPAYLQRLNNPTPWTIRSVPLGVGMNKTFCSVEASVGHGIGGCLGVIQFSPTTVEESRLSQWLTTEQLPELATQSGLCGAHLLVGDAAASRTQAKERELRSEVAAVADWTVLVEGYDAQVVEAACRDLAGPAGLLAHGATQGSPSRFLYRLDFYLDGHEVEQAAQ